VFSLRSHYLHTEPSRSLSHQIMPEFLLDGPHFFIVGFAHQHLVLQLDQAVETQPPSNDVVDYFFNGIGAVELAELV
jgi:hypothetical protein